MKLARCPDCDHKLLAGRNVSSCPACDADWSYPGWPETCPDCNQDMGGAVPRCPHCDADMAASAKEIADYRRELRRTLSRTRWRNRLIFWTLAIGGPIVARLLGAW